MSSRVCVCVLTEHVGHTVKRTSNAGVVNDNHVNMLRVCVRSDRFSLSARRIPLLHARVVFISPAEGILKINERPRPLLEYGSSHYRENPVYGDRSIINAPPPLPRDGENASPPPRLADGLIWAIRPAPYTCRHLFDVLCPRSKSTRGHYGTRRYSTSESG